MFVKVHLHDCSFWCIRFTLWCLHDELLHKRPNRMQELCHRDKITYLRSNNRMQWSQRVNKSWGNDKVVEQMGDTKFNLRHAMNREQPLSLRIYHLLLLAIKFNCMRKLRSKIKANLHFCSVQKNPIVSVLIGASRSAFYRRLLVK